MLEGGIRKTGARIRVTAQLIDATTGTHLLAERYDRDLADIFAVQDEITSLIIGAVRPALYEAEQVRSIRKHPESIDAWAAYQRGVWRLRPRDPRLRVRLAHIGLGHYFGRAYPAAGCIADRLRRDWPGYSFGSRLLALVLAETGQLPEARRVLEGAVALSPAPFDGFSHARMPWYRRGEHARMVRTLRRLGWTGRAD